MVRRMNAGWIWFRRPFISSDGASVIAALLVALLAATTGCEYLSPPHQSWTEAKVIGQVVDGETGQPVARATVSRIHSSDANSEGSGDGDKGGPQMAARPVVAVSNSDGTFTLSGVKTAYLLLDSFPDYAVILRVQARGYQTFQKLYTNVTYAGGDKKTEPMIEVGRIPLQKNGDRR